LGTTVLVASESCRRVDRKVSAFLSSSMAGWRDRLLRPFGSGAGGGVGKSEARRQG